jgi:hypothetical protein
MTNRRFYIRFRVRLQIISESKVKNLRIPFFDEEQKTQTIFKILMEHPSLEQIRPLENESLKVKVTDDLELSLEGMKNTSIEELTEKLVALKYDMDCEEAIISLVIPSSPSKIEEKIFTAAAENDIATSSKATDAMTNPQEGELMVDEQAVVNQDSLAEEKKSDEEVANLNGAVSNINVADVSEGTLTTAKVQLKEDYLEACAAYTEDFANYEQLKAEAAQAKQNIDDIRKIKQALLAQLYAGGSS